MPNPIFFTACLLAICLPILSVQIPRTDLFARLCSDRAENRSPVHTKAKEATTTSDYPSPPPSEPSPKSQSSPPPAEFSRWRTTAGQASKSFDGTHSGAESAEEDKGEVSAVRKPWDPPFSKRGSAQVGEWRALPPSKPRKWRRGARDDCLRTGSLPPDFDGENGGERNEPALSTRSEKSEVEGSDHPERGTRSRIRLLVWGGAAVIAVLLSLLAFSVLIAHCLAWFLVYKTESRLGEVRRGIMKSGDMRLCLCAA